MTWPFQQVLCPGWQLFASSSEVCKDLSSVQQTASWSWGWGMEGMAKVSTKHLFCALKPTDQCKKQFRVLRIPRLAPMCAHTRSDPLPAELHEAGVAIGPKNVCPKRGRPTARGLHGCSASTAALEREWKITALLVWRAQPISVSCAYLCEISNRQLKQAVTFNFLA